jgi:hypothetical protein
MMTEREQALELYKVNSSLRAALTRMLGVSIDNQKRPIARSLRNALNHLNAGQIRLAEFHFLRLIGLANNLLALQSARPDLFQHFSKTLGACTRSEQYYGLRFELQTAASLVGRRIDFQKTESPDFTVTHQTQTVHIECGSTHTGTVTTGEHSTTALRGWSGARPAKPTQRRASPSLSTSPVACQRRPETTFWVSPWHFRAPFAARCALAHTVAFCSFTT